MSIRSTTMSRKLVAAGVCVLSLVICCGLAWWQWERYSSVGGSFQNLGYVLQWPLFGLFPLFMVWRIRRLNQLEKARRGKTAPEQGGPRGGVATQPRTPGADALAARPAAASTAPVAGRDEDDTDDALAEYNRYLAELNAREQKGN